MFIHKDLVVPVVNATINNPDKQFADWDGITCFYERSFDTEVGHGEEGCHYVVRVVTNKKCFPGKPFFPVVTTTFLAFGLAHYAVGKVGGGGGVKYVGECR